MSDQSASRSETATCATAIYAFEVWIPDAPWGDHRQVVNERSLGRAKARYWRDVHDSWESIPFTAVRGRKIGPPQSSREFLIGVGYRGIPDARCGDRVTWNGGAGVIADFGGGGAYLEVIADAGWRGYVHPAECQFEHPARQRPQETP
jgi:hypothetical protein